MGGKTAVIDIGSNSFHMEIFCVKDGKPKSVFRKAVNYRMAEKLMEGFSLRENIADMGEKIVSLVKYAKRRKADYVISFATGIFRKSFYYEMTADYLFKVCGLLPELLSPEDEGRLVWLAAEEYLADGGMLIDMGGGSSEFAFGYDEVYSVPYGTAKFLELNKESAGKFIAKNFPEVIFKRKITALFGTSGFMKMAFFYSRKRQYINKAEELTSEDVLKCYRMLRTDARLKYVAAGALILSLLMDKLGMESITVLPVSLRTGFVKRWLLNGANRPFNLTA